MIILLSRFWSRHPSKIAVFCFLHWYGMCRGFFLLFLYKKKIKAFSIGSFAFVMILEYSSK